MSAALVLALGLLGASEWPQLQHDPQRSGYTPETVKPPFKVAWYRDFQPERVSFATPWASMRIICTTTG